MTINLEVTQVLLNNDGYYPGDPQMIAIYLYENNWGGQSFLVVAPGDREQYMVDSPVVHNPRLLWRRGSGLTVLGTFYARLQSPSANNEVKK